MRRAVGVMVLATACAVGHPRRTEAQVLVRSWLPWRTIETRHFAFHYPVQLEAWTQYLASRMESIDSAVTGIVGYSVATRTHIVIDDPYAVPNGSAWPFLRKPVINFWATPPDPREDIGEFRVWGEMLASHEFAHIVHLSRPSRNRFIRTIWEAMPVDLGPIPLKAPRWVIEGYATYVEGRVTGSGRPHGAWRAAFLREWAIEGQLPTYDQMSEWGAFAGGEFAYLAGSAYLEWLVARAGDSSLVHLWRRLSARQDRTFDDAFTGVFGETPRVLYGRFAVELTGKALAAQRELAKAAGDTGDIVQRLAFSTGDPAISADGLRIALVVHSAARPARVVIWKTAPEPDTLRAKRDSILLAEDPQDVPARPIYPPPKRPIATLSAVGASAYEQPRFLGDGRVLLWRNTARGDGSLAPDLYLWTPSRHRTQRVTKGAYVREADPAPDGRSAVAMQCIHGWCDLVIVDLATGTVRHLAAGSPTVTWYRPRWSPDGSRIVASVQTGSVWRIAVIDPLTGTHRLADPSDGANRYDACFVSMDTVLVTSDREGVPNIERLDLSTGSTTPLSAATGAAVAPEINPRDHSVWFLSLYSRGYDLRRLPEANTGAHQIVALDPTLAPAAPPPRVEPTLFTPRPTGSPQLYSLGDRLFRWIPAPQYGADGGSGLLALVSSDIVGKSELLVEGAAGDLATWRGGAASLTWRGTRSPLRVSVFDASQTATANRAHVVVDQRLDERLRGGTISLDPSATFETVAITAHMGASHATGFRLGDSTLGPAERNLVFLAYSGAWTWRGDAWQVAAFAGGNSTFLRYAESWRHVDLTRAGLTLAGPFFPPLAFLSELGQSAGTLPFYERFTVGGLPSPLIDRAVLAQRIAMPVLPTGVATGNELLTYRVSFPSQVSPYVWGARLPTGLVTLRNGRLETDYEWHRVVGLDATLRAPNVTIAGTPAARAQLGIGESLDAPLRHRVQAYVSLIVNP